MDQMVAVQRRAMHVVVATVLALVGAGLFVVTTPQEAKAAKPLTPLGEVLVVSNNVYEADKPDFRKLGDMRNFVEEVLQNSKYAPDIVLVQELRASAAANIRDFFSNKTGHKYAIATNAGRMPWRWIDEPRIILGTDCAVIFNTKTMKKVAGGYITTKHPYSDGSGGKVEWKRASWARLVERPRPSSNAAPLKMSAVSLHFPRQTNFKSQSIGQRYKRKWSAKIARFLNNKFGSGGANNLHTIAGDFNSHRCTDGTGYGKCPKQAFYRLLTQDFNYNDMIADKYVRGDPIDFIFSTGSMLDAFRDENNLHNPGAPNFYSNHDLLWALIGRKRN